MYRHERTFPLAAELHMLSIGLQELISASEYSRGRISSSGDAAHRLLLQQIIQNTIPRFRIGSNIPLTYIMEEIKIKVLSPALHQLLVQGLLYLAHIAEIVALELIHQIEALSRIPSQGFADGNLRLVTIVAQDVS